MNIPKAKFNKLQTQILNSVKIDLKAKGPVQVIINNGNPVYYQQRANEALINALSLPEPRASEERLLAMRLLLLTEMHYAAAKEVPAPQGS